MKTIIDKTLSILLVEDIENKSSKVENYIIEIAPKAIIKLANDQIKALRFLETEKFDLMLLDMCLPVRHKESELEKDGGEKLLEELDINDTLFQPGKIIALTEYEELRSSLREKFPELGAIKFDNTSDNWKKGLERTLRSISKSKIERKIIYCEEQNDKLYNSIGFSNIEFRGLKGGSRKVYEMVKFEKDKYGIRDKDFITKNEVKWLTKSHLDNYFILDYYCFENYIYHPENLYEYCLSKGISFDVETYKEEIINQKNTKFLKIVQEYQIARNSYFDFTDNAKNNMDKEPELCIVESLKSDDFETFYPYFDMKGTDKKKGIDKTFLDSYNFDKRELVKTNWFKGKIEKIITKIL